MIERLVDLERQYGEPEYSKLSKQIIVLQEKLKKQLGPEGKEWLEQLCDAYIRQGTVILYDVFADGFWSAVDIMVEYLRHKNLS